MKICFISLVHLMILFCIVVFQCQSFKPSEPLWESTWMEILIVIYVLVLIRMSVKRERRGSNLFKDSCLSDVRFSIWLQKESPTSAKCKLCRIVIDIKNMGVSSLTSHMKEFGVSAATVSFFAAKSVPDTSSTTEPSSSKRTTVKDFVVSANVLNAEIKWSLKYF